MSYKPDSEDAAIEQPTIALFAELGWETLNCYHENFGPLSLLDRRWPMSFSRIASTPPSKN